MKGFIYLKDHTFDVVQRKLISQNIVFRDEDDPDFRKLIVFGSLRDFAGVDETGVESGAFRIGTFIGSLDFYIV